MNVAVIGSGTMGNGIAHVFAQHGFAVALIDVQQPALDRALGTVAKNLDRQVAKGTLAEADKAATLGRIRPFTSLAEGVADAELVVEAATENASWTGTRPPGPCWRRTRRPSPSPKSPPLRSGPRR